jgi:hypothetical protein
MSLMPRMSLKMPFFKRICIRSTVYLIIWFWPILA